MNHIIWDVFTAMRARTCYRVFVITLFRALYSTCRHILIPSNPRLNLNYQKDSLQPSRSSQWTRISHRSCETNGGPAVNSEYLWRFDLTGFRGLLYSLAKLMGDYNVVKKGKVGKRVGPRVAGKATGKAMRKLFK